MKETLREIACALQADSTKVDAAWLDKLVRRRNRATHDVKRRVAKKRLLPEYLRMREREPETLREWGVNAQVDEEIVRLLRAKPRRTASGVATITVLTKPWPCSSDCLYCPNDVRMPKSYLAAEPACQRAEHNYFDPYLQVTSRLRVLADMGHVTDKVELIVLGGTFSDYPASYQIWFVSELFRALNDAGMHPAGGSISERARKRAADYEAARLLHAPDALASSVAFAQADVNAHKISYNEAFAQLYGENEGWDKVSRFQSATLDELTELQRSNERAAHRAVGLVVETRPDAITVENLLRLRQLGCTKVQMGVQSLDQRILDINTRGATVEQIVRAFEALRLFGFKSHIHMMANLPGANPESDQQEYRQLMKDPRFIPDEVKLYPCALVESSRLMQLFESGEWHPYSEEELVSLLADDVIATPPYTRISRMIRDISATDIVAGNKKTNLRQMVELRLAKMGCEVQEMRMREIATGEVAPEQLRLERISYETTVSTEYFLQWVTPENKLAAFLRLSLPNPLAMQRLVEEVRDLDAKNEPAGAQFHLAPNQAMIREVHVYGKVAALHQAGESAQHVGLGRRLIEEACSIADSAGMLVVNVISSVGTREYYRNLGFVDRGLYQARDLRQQA